MIAALSRRSGVGIVFRLSSRQFATVSQNMIQKQRPVRLAILECDTPLPQTEKQYGGYGNVFKALLQSGAKLNGFSKLDSIIQVDCYDVENYPESYPDPENIDAVLLTGSRHDSFTDAKWILNLVDYTQRLLEGNRVKIIGVCFGHQIVARAMGVEVGRNPSGWEAAVTQIDTSPTGKELFGTDILNLHQMHRDIAFEDPQGTAGLGSSPACKVQGIYHSKQVITTQGHPEFDEPIMREIIETRHQTGIFDDEAYEFHIKKVALPHDGLIVGKAFVNFLLDA